MAKGLGRGLGALLGGDEPAQGPVRTLRIHDIEPNPRQPRRQFDPEALRTLAESIQANGLLQPLVVRRAGEGYEIIAGERRWRAARMAGLSELPAVVLEADDRQSVELALVENLQREDLNPLEEAEGLRALTREFGLSQEEAAAKVGRSRPAVANALRLLSLPAEILALVREGKLSGGHARALLMFPDDPGLRVRAALMAVETGMSVRELEKFAQTHQKAKKSKKCDGDGLNHLADVQSRLSAALGRRITFHNGRKKGYVAIEYYGNEDLEALLSVLSAVGGQTDAADDDRAAAAEK